MRGALRSARLGPEVAQHVPRWIPLTIAAVSALSAVASWRAAAAAIAAADVEEEAAVLLIQREQREGEINEWVEHDRRLFALYLGHVEAAKSLRAEAAEIARELPAQAAALANEAQGETAAARALLARFEAAEWPLAEDFAAPPRYDAEYVRSNWLRTDDGLAELRSTASSGRAAEDRRRARLLVGLVAVLAVSLLMLTVARFSRPARQLPLAAGGSVVAVAGLCALVALEARVL